MKIKLILFLLNFVVALNGLDHSGDYLKQYQLFMKSKLYKLCSKEHIKVQVNLVLDLEKKFKSSHKKGA